MWISIIVSVKRVGVSTNDLWPISLFFKRSLQKVTENEDIKMVIINNV